MMPDTIPLLQIALQLHHENRLAEAYSAYQRVLTTDPRHPLALHHLGILDLMANRLAEARRRLITAVQASPTDGGPHFHLGEVARRQGQFDEAVTEYRLAIQLTPALLVAYQSLGELLIELGRSDQAVEPLSVLVQLSPQLSGAWMLLGGALVASGRRPEAMGVYQHIVQLAPNSVVALKQLGELELALGQAASAIPHLEMAIRLDPNDPLLESSLGHAFDAIGNHAGAMPHHRRAAEMMPDSAGALNNLGVAFNHVSCPAQAELHFRKAIAIDPRSASALTNLGSVLHEQGRTGEALQCYRTAMELNPDSPKANSVLLYVLHFNSGFDQQAILDEHRAWADRHLRHLPRVIRATSIDKNPARRLRLGYVSADFRQHVVGRFLQPILQHHDRSRFEIFCYSDTSAADVMTERLKTSADTWRDTAGLNDQQLAQLIADDQIDILLDLTGHMEGSRLLTFARQPAPVQISHIGYPASSGVPQIQYRITDRNLDPHPFPGSDERLLYLPNSFYLYTQEIYTTGVAPSPPMVVNGFTTFGSLNSPRKISDATVELWSAVLRASPGSKLLLAVPPDKKVQDHLASRFKPFGIEPTRLILEPTRSFDRYMKLYDRIDIALDPQPYGGGITTCDALWMGVPVITLVGKTSVGRTGASLLRAIGLNDLVSDTAEEYVRLSTQLATDRDRLKELRRTLRGQLANSPVMNAVQYTADLESQYRLAWEWYCASPSQLVPEASEAGL